MRRALELLTAAREPVPADDESRLRLARRTAAILTGVAGVLALLVVPVATLADPPGFQPIGVVVPAVTAAVLAPLVAMVRLSWRSLYLLVAFATGLLTLGVASAGSRYPLGAVLYLWVGLLGFLFFPRSKAIALTALVATEYGLVLGLGKGYAAPLGWWLFLVVTAVVTGIVLDWLVGRTRALAAAEREARVQLEEAHRKLELVLEDRETLNRTLEERVEAQVRELSALGELRRFLSPQVADTLLEGGHEDLLEPHRREITVLFCDLRGFSAFTSEVEPEEVLAVLAEYYDRIGALLRESEATIGPLEGDGVMAYFNDPVPCADPAVRAVELALAIQSAVRELSSDWRRRGHDLACGVGVASGYATLGLIGFEGKRDYGPVGSVVNRASRLCDQADGGQVLIDAAVHRQLGERCRTQLLDHLELKGFPRPVPVYVVEGVAP